MTGASATSASCGCMPTATSSSLRARPNHLRGSRGRAGCSRLRRCKHGRSRSHRRHSAKQSPTWRLQRGGRVLVLTMVQCHLLPSLPRTPRRPWPERSSTSRRRCHAARHSARARCQRTTASVRTEVRISISPTLLGRTPFLRPRAFRMRGAAVGRYIGRRRPAIPRQPLPTSRHERLRRRLHPGGLLPFGQLRCSCRSRQGFCRQRRWPPQL
mmetsp:Transcript_139301/g.445387  ORF Transcript_139301/g.445387 Transcript_139301/m.445387 type:complete len:213 (-) Transcript_139301:580-1218(-)